MNAELLNRTPSRATPDEAAVSSITNRRRRGFVARLPKNMRDKINAMLDDGVVYADIATEVQKSANPPLPFTLTEDHIRSWKSGGYQDWLKQRENAELVDNELRRIDELLSKADAEEIPHLLTKVAATRFFNYLNELAPARLAAAADAHPTNLIRLLSLVPKLSHEALNTRKFRHAAQLEEPHASVALKRF
jgi:hypothetical protein